MSGKALMTYYAEGSLISRELNDMMTDYAADARFDLAMADDVELYAERVASKLYHRRDILIHQGNDGGEPSGCITPRSLIKQGLIP